MLRVHETVTGRVERRILDWLCRRMPGWATPDHLTALGVAGAALAGVGYACSAAGTGWLWLAIVGVSLNWFGDSLDGSLARHRRTERPRYGFFLDHVSDTVSIALIAIGIGLSPFVLFATAAALLLGYYALVILSLAQCVVMNVFKVSFNRIGPTEIRLMILACTATGIALPTPQLTVGSAAVTPYDLVAAAVALLMVATFFTQWLSIQRQLAATERGAAPQSEDRHWR